MRMDEHIKGLIDKYTAEALRVPGNEALEKFRMAYEQARELGNAFTIRACAANLGAMFIKLGKKDAAKEGLKYLQIAMPPEGQSDGVSNGDLYFNIALGNEVLGQNREAVKFLELALKEYRGERYNLPMEMETLRRLIRLSQIRQRFAEALSWYVCLEEMYEQANRPTDQLLLMIQRLHLQQQMGQQDDASDALDKCCENLDHMRQQETPSVALLVQVSVLLTHFKRLDKAKEYLEEANSLFEVEESKHIEKAMVLQNLGTVYNYMDNWTTAVEYHQQAANIYQFYATGSSDPRLPVQPDAALRCQGHCLANCAFALVKLGDVDEARVMFDRALDLAVKSGDNETKWQMEEALGAVHFRLACHELNLPQPLTADMKIKLSPTRREHLEKSLRWYKKALATASKLQAASMDRILEKCTLVRTFKKNAAVAQQPAQKRTVVVNKEDDSDDDNSSEDEEAEVEDESDDASADEEIEGESEEEPARTDGESREQHGGGDGDDDDDSSEDEEEEEDSSGSGSDDSSSGGDEEDGKMSPLGRTRTAADDEDERSALKDHYRSQLHSIENEGTVGFTKAEINAQHHSSSASASDSDESSNETSDETSDEFEVEDEERRPVPPVPLESPPATGFPSGTYENPLTPSESQTDPQHGNSPSQPGPSGTGYAEIDHDRTKQQGSGESAAEKRHGLNFFISSSDEEGEKMTKQREPADPKPSTSRDNYETMEITPASPGPSSRGNEGTGDGETDESQQAADQKKSKICSIM